MTMKLHISTYIRSSVYDMSTIYLRIFYFKFNLIEKERLFSTFTVYKIVKYA